MTADSWAKPNVGGFEPVIGLMVRFSVVQEAVCQGNGDFVADAGGRIRSVQLQRNLPLRPCVPPIRRITLAKAEVNKIMTRLDPRTLAIMERALSDVLAEGVLQ